MFNIKEFIRGLRIKPKTTPVSDTKGELEVRDSDGKLIYHDGTTRSAAVTEAHTATLTNKTVDSASNTLTIDADEATVSNLEVDNLKAGVLDTDISTTSASDDTIPSAKAVKTYVDDSILTKDEASEISFDDTSPNVTGANVQVATVDVADSAAAAQTTADDHISDATDAHAASAITNTPSGNLAATTAQGALNELQTDVDTRATGTDLSNHESDTSTHGVGEVVGTTETQAITGKDIDGGTASNTSRITIPKDTTTNLDALTDKEATIAYDTTLNEPVFNTGATWSPFSSGYTHPNHSGEVTSTGDGAQVLDKTSITNKTLVTAASADHVLISDNSDSDNLKKVAVSDLLGGGGGGSASRNMVINPSFDIWQRNTTFNSTTGATEYTADRFQYQDNGPGKEATTDKVADSPSSSKSDYCMEIVPVSGTGAMPAGELYGVSQKIEGYDFKSAHDKDISISFWVKSAATGPYAVTLMSTDAARRYIHMYSISVANTWEQKTFTLTHDSTGTWDTGNGTGMFLYFVLAAGTASQQAPGSEDTWQTTTTYTTTAQANLFAAANSWKITDIQVEQSSAASDFDDLRRPIEQEIALCQRFYEKSYDIATNVGTVVVNGQYHCLSASTGTVRQAPVFAVPKRAAPTTPSFRPGCPSAPS